MGNKRPPEKSGEAARKDVDDAEMAKLIKAGLSKQLGKRFLKKTFEARKC